MRDEWRGMSEECRMNEKMYLSKIKKMYFLGIGGIGMSALARYFNLQGKQIFGYDLTPTPLTDELAAEGMHIHFEEDPGQIPPGIDLAVFTPAIPDRNKELAWMKANKTPLLKRAELIGQLSREHFTIAVAGTHGKTSITAIAAHLLKSAGLKLTAFVGGICLNYRSNLIYSETTDYLLVEADEFDRSFLQLQPDIALISSMDADHLDIYKNKSGLTAAFEQFAGLPGKSGTLIRHKALAAFPSSESNTVTYGIGGGATIGAKNIRVREVKFVFDLETGGQKIADIAMKIPGRHYIENALAAAAISLQLGLDAEQIKTGLESFKGVERRFEVRINNKDLVFIDDYAHHPEEINATIEAVRTLYPDQKLTVVFQPHLFSRTRDFAEGFAGALSKADRVFLLDIYPAREKPIPGVSSESILARMTIDEKSIVNKTRLLENFRQNNYRLVLSMGAGDIGLMVHQMEKALQNK